ncbi:UvrD-helicase domain-containing protein [Cupriavidus plantarum]|uniref:UvrD-helicase domain-containing protein n=1 Tax=Cupriavidus plantarum TaxID=942865 RepID=UPI001B23359A|nr:UvrD-helicase domain-containing protein [Cupriavidus plantarum]CAG2153180.1 ATP-dependent helicase/nuclease subunit A [Cupriavidus plantarum]SMR66005.1 DNA helicase/exodeoxyribonuclease V, subunit A [Cupriavidus plantarum]
MSANAYLRDGHPVAESEFTRAACDPSRSVVVEACAGSGKTWLLVARLVRLLLAGAQPHEILAITFTRKAAEEMRERLLEVLSELASGTDDAVMEALTMRGLTPDAARDALPRARQLHAQVLASPGRMAIDTFHGWFGTLLRGAPLSSGIVPGAMLREDALRMKREAWAPFWRALASPQYEDLRAAYAELVDAIGEFQTRALLDRMFHARSEWWALRDDGGDPAAKLAADLGDDAVTDVLVDALCDDSWLGDAGDCQQLASLLGTGGKTEQGHATAIAEGLAAIRAWRAAGRQGGSAAADAFMRLRAAFFTQAGKPRSLRRTAALTKAAGGEGAVEALLARHADHCARLDAIAARRCEAAVLAVNLALYKLGDALLARYQQYKSEARAMDFADLEWLAARLMSDEETATYLQVRLDARYKHLLLDEFQDTNPLQWRILQGWLAGYQGLNERPTVFLVGDPKQSIYRFRRADARLFGAASAMLEAEFGATVLRTNRTRRNRPEVLDWVNAVFDAGRAEGRYPLYETQTTALDGPGGPVWVLPLVEADRDAQDDENDDGRVGEASEAEDGVSTVASAATHRDTLRQPRTPLGDSLRFEEGRRVAAWLRHIRDNVPVQDGKTVRRACWRDVQLLVRRKSHLADYERAFREAGIPCLSPRRGGLLATLEALDISALLAFLMTPESDLDLAHVLKSPIVGASDEDLLLLAGPEAARGWWARIEATGLPPEVSDAVRGGVARLRAWLALAPHKPVHDLIDRIYHEGEIRRRYAEAAPAAIREQVLANLDAFLKLSLDLDGGRYPSLPKFIGELQEIRRGDEDESPDEGGMGESVEDGEAEPETDSDSQIDAVHILTVHAAKGLEAPFVVLLDANHSDPAPDRAGILIDWPPSSRVPTHFSAYGKQAERGLARQPMFDAEAALAERENWNLLYVAMTRARQGLIVSGVKGRPTKDKGKEKEQSGSEIAGSWYVRLAAAGVGEAVTAYPEATRAGGAEVGADVGADFGGDVGGDGDPRVRYTDFRERFRDAVKTISAEEAAMAGLGDEDDTDDGIVFDAAAARHGELVHALLERITRYPQAFGSVPDADTVLRWFPATGAGAPGTREQWREQIVLAVSEAAAMLKAPALRPLLFPDAAVSARNEVELYDARGRLLRIDRLVEFEDRVVIVDYKLRLLPQEHAAYGAQLARYVAAITPMFPGKRIEAGVATADGEWIDAGSLRPVVHGEQGSLF